MDGKKERKKESKTLCLQSSRPGVALVHVNVKDEEEEEEEPQSANASESVGRFSASFVVYLE